MMRKHTVIYPENLAVIAQRYYRDPECAMSIYQANRDVITDPNRIYPGQVLVIPHLPYHAPKPSVGAQYG